MCENNSLPAVTVGWPSGSIDKFCFCSVDLSVGIHVRQTKVEKQEQVLLYGGSDFIADVGGYLGLLLGVSCFSIYKYINEFASVCLKCKTRFHNKESFK